MVIALASCQKDPIDRYLFRGIVVDEVSRQPVANVAIKIDAIRAGSGMGIINGGRRKPAGNVVTDANGRFECKLKVFESADEIDFFINTLSLDFAPASVPRIPVSDLKSYRNNPLTITLRPTATLLVHFKNTNPISGADYFYISSAYPQKSFFSPEINLQTNCGTVQPESDVYWTGQNVCGTYKIKTAIDDITELKWYSKKNNITKPDSAYIYCPRNKITEYTLSY
ncbi:MAG: hypothetical protein M3142_08550 [Bacteroidota bacterium]|nr:hypothetical protein [Bacteroidota bacterium]